MGQKLFFSDRHWNIKINRLDQGDLKCVEDNHFEILVVFSLLKRKLVTNIHCFSSAYVTVSNITSNQCIKVRTTVTRIIRKQFSYNSYDWVSPENHGLLLIVFVCQRIYICAYDITLTIATDLFLLPERIAFSKFSNPFCLFWYTSYRF